MRGRAGKASLTPRDDCRGMSQGRFRIVLAGYAAVGLAAAALLPAAIAVPVVWIGGPVAALAFGAAVVARRRRQAPEDAPGVSPEDADRALAAAMARWTADQALDAAARSEEERAAVRRA